VSWGPWVSFLRPCLEIPCWGVPPPRRTPATPIACGPGAPLPPVVIAPPSSFHVVQQRWAPLPFISLPDIKGHRALPLHPFLLCTLFSVDDELVRRSTPPFCLVSEHGVGEPSDDELMRCLMPPFWHRHHRHPCLPVSSELRSFPPSFFGRASPLFSPFDCRTSPSPSVTTAMPPPP
jgi:hypothetical protein